MLLSPALDALLQLSVMLQSSGGGSGSWSASASAGVLGSGGSEQYVAACASNAALVRSIAIALEFALGELSSAPTLAPELFGETQQSQPPRLNELFLRVVRTLEKLAVVVQRVSTFKCAIFDIVDFRL